MQPITTKAIHAIGRLRAEFERCEKIPIQFHGEVDDCEVQRTMPSDEILVTALFASTGTQSRVDVLEGGGSILLEKKDVLRAFTDADIREEYEKRLGHEDEDHSLLFQGG